MIKNRIWRTQCVRASCSAAKSTDLYTFSVIVRNALRVASQLFSIEGTHCVALRSCVSQDFKEDQSN